MDRQTILIDDIGGLTCNLLVMSEQEDLRPAGQLVEYPKPGGSTWIIEMNEQIVKDDRECASLLDDVFKCCQAEGQVELIAGARA